MNRKMLHAEWEELIPWWTYSSICFLNAHINHELRVFEYGCGYSTLWLAGRVDEVISVEHDIRWIEKIKQKVPENVKIIYGECEKGYENEIINHGLFDIVVIDGINRVRCAGFAVNALQPGGIIIWDDSQREKYKKAIDELISHGFKEIDFYGVNPVDMSVSKTSLIYKEDNCLGI